MIVQLSPDGESSVVGSSFTVTARVTRGGVPVSSKRATFFARALPGGDLRQLSTATTNAQGMASARYTRDTDGVDSVTVKVDADGGVQQSIAHTWLSTRLARTQHALEVALGPADLTTLVDDRFTAAAVVTDGEGEPVEGAAVHFAAYMPGSPSVPYDTQTNENGLATFEHVRGAEGAEQVVVTATDGGLRSSDAIGHTWVDEPHLGFSLRPQDESSPVQRWFTVVAGLTRQGRPVPGARLKFISSTPEQQRIPGHDSTDAHGQASFTWRRFVRRTVDQVTASYTLPDGRRIDKTLVHTWTGRAPAPGTGLRLDDSSVAPGAVVRATGGGCRGGAGVSISLDGIGLTRIRADSGGGYAAQLRVPTRTATGGDHSVTAACGVVTDSAPLDVSRPGAEAATPAAAGLGIGSVLLFLGVLAGQAVRFATWRSGPPPAPPG